MEGSGTIALTDEGRTAKVSALLYGGCMLSRLRSQGRDSLKREAKPLSGSVLLLGGTMTPLGPANQSLASSPSYAAFDVGPLTSRRNIPYDVHVYMKSHVRNLRLVHG